MSRLYLNGGATSRSSVKSVCSTPITRGVTNIGPAHSVPTDSNRRGVFLKAEVADAKGCVVANQEWMFAPWYGDRPRLSLRKIRNAPTPYQLSMPLLRVPMKRSFVQAKSAS